MLPTLYSVLLLAQAGLAQSPTDFFRETYEEMLRNDPEMATYHGRHEYDDRWTDWSKAADDRRRELLEKRLETLSRFTDANLTPADRLTVRLLRYDFRSRLDAWDLEERLLRVGQLFGFHNRVYLIIDRMPVRTVHDYENILARI